MMTESEDRQVGYEAGSVMRESAMLVLGVRADNQIFTRKAVLGYLVVWLLSLVSQFKQRLNLVAFMFVPSLRLHISSSASFASKFVTSC